MSHVYAEPRPSFTARHPLAVSITVTVIVVVFGAGNIIGAAASEEWAWLALPLTLGIACSVAAIWLRHRYPVEVAVGIAVVIPLIRLLSTGLLQDEPISSIPETDTADVELLLDEQRLPKGAGLAGLLALYTVARHRRARIAWLVFGLYLGLRTAAELTWIPREDILFGLIPSILLDLVITLVGTNTRSRRQRLEALAGRNRQLALERDMREQIAVSAERNRIAREMHDVVAHSLSVMITLADGASATLERDPAQARGALEEISSTGRASLTDTRRLVGVLRDTGPTASEDEDPSPLTPQPTSEDLHLMIERFRHAGLPVRFTSIGAPLPNDAFLHLTIFRIVQEGLTNVLRHAPGSPRIDATVIHVRDMVEISVVNEMSTRPATMTGSQRGLIGIRERVAAYSGTVTAGPTPSGWRLHATLPLR